jgi:8-amino-7-oxononanoate synthase
MRACRRRAALGAQLLWFRHNSPENLDQKLSRLPKGNGTGWSSSKGCIRSTGDVSPLAEIVDVCQRHGAYLLVDEAHSFVVWRAGRGWAEAQGVLPQVDFLVGTVLEGARGHRRVLRVGSPRVTGLHFTARAYLFTASDLRRAWRACGPPFRIISRDSSFRDRLWSEHAQVPRGTHAPRLTRSAPASRPGAGAHGTERATIGSGRA